MSAEILLTARQLEKSFGARPLFSGVSVVVAAGERIGLIGPNGAGKSTLLKIIAGRLSPDDGELAPRRGLRIGYLEQAPAFPDGATVLATLAAAATGEEEWHRDAASRDAFARLGLAAAGIEEETPIEALSGGWRKRIAVGRELVRQPDLLLLDEPTNHLDVDGIEWLEELLAAARFAAVTVTHDRVFLQRVATRIVELDRRHQGGLLSVDGGYLRYLEVRGQNLAAQERREVVLGNTLRRETEWLRRGAQARSTKQNARIQRAGALANEVSELATRNVERTAELELSATGRSPKRLIEAEGISKAFGDRVLFRDENVRLAPGTRLGLLGANGCGKSTLIRVLVGQEAPDAGRVVRADALQIAYFEQGREALDPAATVRDTLCPGGDHVELGGKRMHVRGYLDRFLFTAEQTEVQVGKLSGGEQSRLLLARLMLRPANLLILDEPTNDLDTATLTVLEEALLSFPGAVLLVTHDRYFLDQVATEIVAFPRHSGAGLPLQRFASLAQWERWHRDERTSATPRKAGAADAPAAPARKKLSYAERLELEGIEARILEAEAIATIAETALANPEHASNAAKLIELTSALEQARVVVDGLYARWEQLEAKRGGV